MNLNKIAAGVVSGINPKVVASYRRSSGASSAASGKRTPTYEAAVDVLVQKQPLTGGELRQVQGLNINGEFCALYVDAEFKGVSRPQARGGDLFTLPDDSVWLVKIELEDWYATAGWSKVACVRQNNA